MPFFDASAADEFVMHVGSLRVIGSELDAELPHHSAGGVFAVQRAGKLEVFEQDPAL